MILKQNFVFGKNLYSPLVIITTIKEEQSGMWHTLLRGGHFFSAYQPVVGEILNEEKYKLAAVKIHNEIVRKIKSNKNQFFDNMMRGPKKCI